MKRIIILVIAVLVLLLGFKFYTDKQKEKTVNAEVSQEETVQNPSETNETSKKADGSTVQSEEMDNGFEPLEIEEDYTVELDNENQQGALIE